MSRLKRRTIRWSLGFILAAMAVLIAQSAWILSDNDCLHRRLDKLGFHSAVRGEWAPYIYSATVLRDSDGSIIVVSNELGAEEGLLTDGSTAQQHQTIAYLSYFVNNRRCGFWAVTQVVKTRSIAIDGNEQLEERGALQQACVEHLAASGEDKSASDLLPTGRAREVKAVWSGYVHNLGAGIFLTALLFSIVQTIRRGLVTAIRQRRVAANRCALCGYPLSESQHGGCPECGWVPK